MQNFKLKNRMSVSLLLLLTALFVCFNPGYAFADLLGCMQSEAGRGIFKTMACKITTTRLRSDRFYLCRNFQQNQFQASCQHCLEPVSSVDDDAFY